MAHLASLILPARCGLSRALSSSCQALIGSSDRCQTLLGGQQQDALSEASHQASTSAPSTVLPSSQAWQQQRRTVATSSQKRFWKSVTVNETQQGYQVLLDRTIVKTPAKHELLAPTRPLALAIAAEWAWQEKTRPLMISMPLMSLAATAIDQPKPRDRVIDSTLKYIHTDSACCRYEPGALADKQAQVFDPILAQLHARLGWKLGVSESIAGAHHDDATVAAIHAWLQGLDGWNLAAAEQLTASCKSLALAAAVMHGLLHHRDAYTASRVEEDFQLTEWGRVEAGHDLDEADLATRIAAPAVLLALLRPPSA